MISLSICVSSLVKMTVLGRPTAWKQGICRRCNPATCFNLLRYAPGSAISLLRCLVFFRYIISIFSCSFVHYFRDFHLLYIIIFFWLQHCEISCCLVSLRLLRHAKSIAPRALEVQHSAMFFDALLCFVRVGYSVAANISHFATSPLGHFHTVLRCAKIFLRPKSWTDLFLHGASVASVLFGS